MRVLVTGASGFIGSRAVTRLASAGVSVRALVRRSMAHGAENRPERVRGDVTDATSLRRAVAGCEVVFHCAWGGTTLEEQRQINVQGTRKVLEAAAQAGVRRVVHISSMAVHGYKFDAVLTEDAPLNFQSDPYGISKAEGEVAAFERGGALGVEVVALRPPLVYGPRSPIWLVGYCERVKNEQVALIDGGEGIVNLVHVDDLVDAMWLAAKTPAVVGEAFLISGPQSVTWREYLGHFATMCGKPLPPSVPLWRARHEVQWLRVYGTLTQYPRRLQGMDLSLMTQNTAVSIDKARRLLDYAPGISLAEGMNRCERWLRQEGYLPPGWNGVEPQETVAAIGGQRRDASVA
jgi:nucleoside-diphosphate-sugar epimerase